MPLHWIFSLCPFNLLEANTLCCEGGKVLPLLNRFFILNVNIIYPFYQLMTRGVGILSDVCQCKKNFK